MDLAGYVINAVLVEGRNVDDVSAAHGVSRSWLYELIARYRTGGEAGLEPQSRRPRSSPTRLAPAIEDEIVQMRKTPHRGRPRRRAPDHPGAPAAPPSRTSPRRGAIGVDDLAGPGPPRVRRPPAPEATQELLETVPSGPAQRVLAGRHHPLGARRWHRRRDPQRHRRPLPAAHRVTRVRHRQSRRRRRDVPSRRATWGYPASMLTDNGAIFTAQSRNGTCAIELELIALGIGY